MILGRSLVQKYGAPRKGKNVSMASRRKLKALLKREKEKEERAAAGAGEGQAERAVKGEKQKKGKSKRKRHGTYNHCEHVALRIMILGES